MADFKASSVPNAGKASRSAAAGIAAPAEQTLSGIQGLSLPIGSDLDTLHNIAKLSEQWEDGDQKVTWGKASGFTTKQLFAPIYKQEMAYLRASAHLLQSNDDLRLKYGMTMNSIQELAGVLKAEAAQKRAMKIVEDFLPGEADGVISVSAYKPALPPRK